VTILENVDLGALADKGNGDKDRVRPKGDGQNPVRQALGLLWQEGNNR
jgi:hypothetical protein